MATLFICLSVVSIPSQFLPRNGRLLHFFLPLFQRTKRIKALKDVWWRRSTHYDDHVPLIISSTHSNNAYHQHVVPILFHSPPKRNLHKYFNNFLLYKILPKISTIPNFQFPNFQIFYGPPKLLTSGTKWSVVIAINLSVRQSVL